MMDKIMLPLIHYKGNKFKDNKKLLNTAVITKHMSAVQQGTENNSKRSKHQDFKINNSTHNYVKYIKMGFSRTNKSLYTCLSVLQT